MLRPSWSSILTVLFFLLIFKSIHSLFGIFQVPVCEKGDRCYKSYLHINPKLDLYVFVSDNSRSGNHHEIFHLNDFDYKSILEKQVTLEISKSARKNGSIIIHSVLAPSKTRRTEDFEDIINLPDSTYIKSKLTKYSIPVSTTFNLLQEKGKNVSWKPVTHLRSRYSVIMCTDDIVIPHSAVPMEIISDFRINRQKEFLPLFHPDIINMRMKDLIEITPQTTHLNFTYIYTPTSIGKMRFLRQIGLTLQQSLDLGFTEKDLDEVKAVFADTNLYLLCLTMFVGSVHLLLDFLSFKNDVSFWKSHKSMAGLSSRTVLWRAFSQTIVFLFLLDEGTSLLVVIPSGIGTLIEFWKVSKVFKTTLSWKGFKFNTEQKESDDEKKTREYDEECMRYLSYLLYPLCAAAAVYSLIYQPHKSWYSWTINSLVNGVYAFGFLFMLPQLFINYRLKSVAALPWRAFTYRAFNTFIDDIFAFIITMPIAHRVACFRDDVVFLIYLYQRWLYPVDKTRIDDITGESIVVEEKKSDEKEKKKGKKDN